MLFEAFDVSLSAETTSRIRDLCGQCLEEKVTAERRQYRICYSQLVAHLRSKSGDGMLKWLTCPSTVIFDYFPENRDQLILLIGEKDLEMIDAFLSMDGSLLHSKNTNHSSIDPDYRVMAQK